MKSILLICFYLIAFQTFSAEIYEGEWSSCHQIKDGVFLTSLFKGDNRIDILNTGYAKNCSEVARKSIRAIVSHYKLMKVGPNKYLHHFQKGYLVNFKNDDFLPAIKMRTCDYTSWKKNLDRSCMVDLDELEEIKQEYQFVFSERNLNPTELFFNSKKCLETTVLNLEMLPSHEFNQEKLFRLFL